MKLQAYNNDPKFRAVFIAEMQAHQDADMLVRGSYGEGEGCAFRGCAVGCAIHSLMKIQGKKSLDFGNHELFPKFLGVPVEIAYLIDGLFESLPADIALKFPLRVVSAIHSGADLSMIIPQFLYWLLADPADGGDYPGLDNRRNPCKYRLASRFSPRRNDAEVNRW